MSTSFSVDRRISMCTFIFADGRHCRTPHSPNHPALCTYHARKDLAARASKKVGEEISYDLSGNFTTANDVTSALCHLFSAVAMGHVKPRTANTLAYLGQTLVQSAQLAQQEYIETFGKQDWRDQVAHHLYPENSDATPADPAQGTDRHPACPDEGSERSEESSSPRDLLSGAIPSPILLD
jgi:hypothetical protein